MIVSINQPAYLPWLGYFDRIARSDIHIVLDNVQIERNTKTSFTNRNRIKTSQGPIWLTIPIKRASSSESDFINTTEIDGVNWAVKHGKTFSQAYSRARYYDKYMPWFSEFFGKVELQLAPILERSTRYFLDTLDIRTKIVFASHLDVSGKKSDLILNLCREVGATEYLSGPFGRSYLSEDTFRSQGIQVRYHDYNHPTYPQLHGDFVPFMSIVDLLFNCGDDSRSFMSIGD